ncbi:MAG: methyl-accepting chemotaxis protein, partial [Myxococcales bacterium]|nr:methyl-accepting chemotaxis protein [Myxococcales bacterium]
LAGSATQIAAAVTGVQQNAERNLANSDEMTREINELSARSQGIGELLELIRDISDRSDILALNGALEATRAGEVGRGFALVSGEMRRLAERVSGTVAKVRDLVADINVASVSTVMASAHGRDLAEDTTRAAREIADEIRRQSGETEQALAGVGEVAGLLEQIGQGTHQSRRIAEGLGLEAANLEQLLDHFDLDDQ